jgi:hypothetical protein
MTLEQRIEQSIFFALPNPIYENETVIYERAANKSFYRFTVHKANFDDDHDFNNFIEYLVDSLNKNLEK